jgi:hypothetical protein
MRIHELEIGCKVKRNFNVNGWSCLKRLFYLNLKFILSQEP